MEKPKTFKESKQLKLATAVMAGLTAVTGGLALYTHFEANQSNQSGDHESGALLEADSHTAERSAVHTGIPAIVGAAILTFRLKREIDNPELGNNQSAIDHAPGEPQE